MKKLVGTISVPREEVERTLTDELMKRNEELRTENASLRQQVKDLEQALRDAQRESA